MSEKKRRSGQFRTLGKGEDWHLRRWEMLWFSVWIGNPFGNTQGKGGPQWWSSWPEDDVSHTRTTSQSHWNGGRKREEDSGIGLSYLRKRKYLTVTARPGMNSCWRRSRPIHWEGERREMRTIVSDWSRDVIGTPEREVQRRRKRAMKDKDALALRRVWDAATDMSRQI